MMEKLIRAIAHLVGMAKVLRVDDSGAVLRLQIDRGPYGERGSQGLRDDTAFAGGAYGHYGVPPLGADAVALSISGDRSRTVVLGVVDPKSRLKGLQPGDAAMGDVRGAYLKLTAAGLEIDAANLPIKIYNAATITLVSTGAVRVEAPTLQCTGEIVAHCDGTAIALGTHKHAGVTAGGAVSSGPVP